ncbi:MAG: nucleoside triphosphate pyrophosphohydrolase [Pseudomonadota bacterium]
MGKVDPFRALVGLMEKLRGDGGCPWDREQTHESIRPYAIEEAYEVVDAIDRKDWPGLRDELGDLLLQVVFHAQMASEVGTFDIDGVIGAIHDKLVRRHPHVFRKDEGDEASTADQVLKKWSKIKEKEGREHLLDGIPGTLPALLRASRVGEKAASVGFDWKKAEEVRAKINEELDELSEVEGDPKRVEEEFGDLLFALTSLARHLGVDAESSLRLSTGKFETRFRWMEEEARKNGIELKGLSDRELDDLWNRAKEAITRRS